jgi:hypothetical protein
MLKMYDSRRLQLNLIVTDNAKDDPTFQRFPEEERQLQQTVENQKVLP